MEEAIAMALEKLGLKEDEVDIKVIDEGSKGLLGLIGARDAVVEVRVKVNPAKTGRSFWRVFFRKWPARVKLK